MAQQKYISNLSNVSQVRDEISMGHSSRRSPQISNTLATLQTVRHSDHFKEQATAKFINGDHRITEEGRQSMEFILPKKQGDSDIEPDDEEDGGDYQEAWLGGHGQGSDGDRYKNLFDRIDKPVTRNYRRSQDLK